MFVSAKRAAAAIAAGMLATLPLPVALAQSKDSTAPSATAASRNDPARIDRDGKYICGWELMNDSERAGHKSQLYFTKDLADRDQIRKELCKSMRKRATEKGVPLDE